MTSTSHAQKQQDAKQDAIVFDRINTTTGVSLVSWASSSSLPRTRSRPEKFRALVDHLLDGIGGVITEKSRGKCNAPNNLQGMIDEHEAYVIWMRRLCYLPLLYSTYHLPPTTVMAEIKVWCLVINHNHEPSFGEPFPVLIRHDDTIHDFKMRMNGTPGSPSLGITNNRIEIWRFKSPLSARNSFDQTKVELARTRSTSGNEWRNHAQHLGVAQRVMELELGNSELLLALVPNRDLYIV